MVILKRRSGTSGLDNIIAALEHNDRVCQIDLQYPYKFTTKMCHGFGSNAKAFPGADRSAAQHRFIR
jgi:hypothetical protein